MSLTPSASNDINKINTVLEQDDTEDDILD